MPHEQQDTPQDIIWPEVAATAAAGAAFLFGAF